MDKTKFLYRLQEMFLPLRERTFESIKSEYDSVLTGDIDYQKLYNLFCSEWDSKSRPLASELKGYIARAKIRDVENMSDEAQRVLLHAAMYSASDEWQWKHKKMPTRLKFLVDKYRITDEMIDRKMTSGEVDRFDWDKQARRLYA